MRFFNKYYFFGVGSAILLFIVVNMILMAIFARTFSQPKNGNDKGEEAETSLPPPGSLIDQRIPVYDQAGDLSFTALEGTEVYLSQCRGKVVFLNFWATWCGPCVREMPSLQNLYDTLKNEDVVFLFVSKQKDEVVQNFIEEKQFNFPVYLRDGELPEALTFKGIPTTYILDREGVVVYKHTGSARWDDASCVSFLRNLL